MSIRLASAIGACLGLAVFTPDVLGAQQTSRFPQIIQEFFITDAVYPQEAGETQLTLDTRVDREIGPRLTVEYGVTDRLQIGATTPAIGVSAGDEANTLEIGTLYNLLSGNSPFVLSTALQLALSRGERPEWEPSLIAAKQIGNAQLHASVTAGLRSGEQAEFSFGLASVYDGGGSPPRLSC